MARATSPEPAGAGAAGGSGSRHGRITVCCRVRPLLDSEVAQGVVRAPYALTDTSISLRDRHVGRTNIDSREADERSKTRAELRALDHLRRDESETVMDAVFGGQATTREVYERSFRHIVAGATEGLNGAILAYGQTASGKTYSISGTSAPASRNLDCEDGIPAEKGIIHFALEDLFSQISTKAAADTEGGEREYLVRMSYCELYMERVNDLLRKISPQSQNLPVKEDAESRSFYVEGAKEKIVSSPEEVNMLLAQAEKRRRVAYTRYNEVSSRSHTLLTLYVECSASLEATEGAPTEDRCDEPRVTKVGRLMIVDLAGNERMEAGTEYMAESNSINKSLFFLGKVIEKLSGRERAERQGNSDELERTMSCEAITRYEHVPFRDSKLTRLLSVHLGQNSQTGVLVTLTPAEDSIESSLSTLRFAQKASTIKCVAKPVLISKEQSLIIKQREIIAQLHQQVKELKEAQRQQQAVSDATPRTTSTDCEVSAERQQRVEQLQALTLGGAGSPSNASSGSQAFVSKSREVDAIVTALHRSNDALRKQKATVVDEFRELHRAVAEVSREVASCVGELQAGSLDEEAVQSGLLLNSRTAQDGKPARAWEPAVQELRKQLQALLQSASARMARDSQEHGRSPKATLHASTSASMPTTEGDMAAQLQEAKQEAAALRRALSTVGSSTEDGLQEANAKLREENARLRAAAAEASANAGANTKGSQRDVERQLREDNSRLRASVKFLTAERERLRLQTEQVRAECHASMELPCKRSDGTGKASPGLGQRSASPGENRASLGSFRAGQDKEQLRSPSRRLLTSPEASTRPDSGTTAQSLNDCEPIVEKGSYGLGRLSCASPIRRLDSSLSEFEPIVEHCSASPFSTASDAPRPPLSPNRSAPPRPPDSRTPGELAPRLAMDYFRQVGVRTNWRPGDTAYWRGQQCKVVKVVTEDQPLYVVIRTPGGSEVTTDLCLLAECPPSGRVAGVQAVSDGPDCGRPLRLAPLNDLCLDRPTVLDRPGQAGADRPPSLPDPRMSPGRSLLENGGSGDGMAINPEKIVGRSASLPARGLSPVKPPARLTASSQGRTRCMSPSPGQLAR
mmetsp:Transcript_94122/g.176909  ORF Transcript_94122/g.176909 Transcript_94122/m.176909 type:complete len:1089 (+) Transcript_94122:152-3418(+)